MKNRCRHLLHCACLIITAFLLAGCPFINREASWNFLVYMVADNDLESYAISDFNELELIGSTNSVCVFVLIDRIPGYDSSNGDWTGTRLYRIAYDSDPSVIHSELLADYGELDMSDPATLRDFIIACQAENPAPRTMLTLWGHGDGVYPRSVAPQTGDLQAAALDDPLDPSVRGVCNDFTTGTGAWDLLTSDEVAQALAQARAVTGKKIDVFNMDACSMFMIEVAYEWRNEIDFLVGSETLTPAAGNNYYGILQYLNADPAALPRDAAIAIVDAFYAKYSTSPFDRTYSALSLGSEFSALISAFNAFATALDNTADQAGALASWNDAVSCNKIEYKDLYSFAEETVAHMTADPAVTAAAAALLPALNAAVIRHYTIGGWLLGAPHGVSILLPDATAWLSYSNPAQYPSFSLSLDTDWNEFILDFITF